MNLLDESSSPSESENEGEAVAFSDGLTINKKYASKFEREARFKDLQRAKDLDLNDDDDDEGEDSGSSSESEDEDGEGLDAKMELQILNTINSLRKKDPRIYDTEATWFKSEAEEEEGEEEEEVSHADKSAREVGTRREKKKTYSTVLREHLLAHGAGGEEEEELNAVQRGRAKRNSNLAYDAEQKGLRESIIKGLASGSNDEEDSDDDDDELFTAKRKTKEDDEEDDEKIRSALSEMRQLGDVTSTEEDRFLSDYLSQKRWKDKLSFNAAATSPVQEDSEDEKLLDEIDRFESEYNFRFEEGTGSTQIVGHARNVSDSFRRNDDKRKLEREARKERKEKERRQMEAELRRLKNLKRQELLERLAKINEVGDAAFSSEELLDEDWDSARYDQQMADQFGDKYYEAEDKDDVELQHPGELEDWGDEVYGDYEDEEQEDRDRKSRERKEAKKLSKDQSEEIEEELYQLDYEDLVAGMPTRFKYKQVDPEGFGLSAEDILLADDDDLNKYVSLKKLSTYRPGREIQVGKLDKKRKRLRVLLREKREKAEEEASRVDVEDKMKKNNKRNKKRRGESDGEVQEENETVGNTADASREKKGRKRRKKASGSSVITGGEGQSDVERTSRGSGAGAGAGVGAKQSNKKFKKSMTTVKEKDARAESAKRRSDLFK